MIFKCLSDMKIYKSKYMMEYVLLHCVSVKGHTGVRVNQ